MKLYKYRNFNSKKWRNIFERDGELWFSCPRYLDDQDEVQAISISLEMPKETKKYLLELRSNISILSFSERFDSEDCWGRYADEKMGFCLEIDVTRFQNLDRDYDLKHVDYIEGEAVVKFGKEGFLEYKKNKDAYFEKIRRTFLYEKKRSWSDQSEVRILHYRPIKHKYLNKFYYKGHCKKFGIKNITKVFYFKKWIKQENLDLLNEVLRIVEHCYGHKIESIALD